VIGNRVTLCLSTGVSPMVRYFW